MKKILSVREKIILSITIAVVLFSAAFNIFLLPILSKNASLNRQISLRAEELRKYNALLGKKKAIEDEYRKLASGVGVLTQAGTSVAALTELESLVNNAEIRIIDIRPGTPKTQNRKALSVEARLEGNMDDFMKFIYSVEQSVSLLSIKKFQLSAKSNGVALEGLFSITEFSAFE